MSSESDWNDSIICVEDSGENQMEVEQKSKTDKKINEHSIVVDKGNTREIIQNVNRDERKSEELGMSKTKKNKKRRTQKGFFITDPASITPSPSDEESTKLISVKIENFNTNMVYLETFLKDFQITAI